MSFFKYWKFRQSMKKFARRKDIDGATDYIYHMEDVSTNKEKLGKIISRFFDEEDSVHLKLVMETSMGEGIKGEFK